MFSTALQIGSHVIWRVDEKFQRPDLYHRNAHLDNYQSLATFYFLYSATDRVQPVGTVSSVCPVPLRVYSIDLVERPWGTFCQPSKPLISMGSLLLPELTLSPQLLTPSPRWKATIFSEQPLFSFSRHPMADWFKYLLNYLQTSFFIRWLLTMKDCPNKKLLQQKLSKYCKISKYPKFEIKKTCKNLQKGYWINIQKVPSALLPK